MRAYFKPQTNDLEPVIEPNIKSVRADLRLGSMIFWFKMFLLQRHHGQVNIGKFALVFKRYRLYTAAIQNTEWYSLTLQWMPSDLQVLVVKKGFLRLSIDRVETKQSQIHGTRVAQLGRGSKAKTARNSGLWWMDQPTYWPTDPHSKV